MSYALGLDFGTTFTAAAIHRNGVVQVATLGNRAGAVPAAVFVRPEGSLLHGEDAFMRGASEPLRLVRNLKRRLGDTSTIEVAGDSFDPAVLVADHLSWAVQQVAEQEGGPAERFVMTHPASWRSSRLDELRRAISLAGLEPILFAEPHAAATFHAESYPLAVGDLIAAYDLGGGTFDAAVLQRTRSGFELAGEPEGEEHLGGIDFDEVVFHLVRSRLGSTWTAAEDKGGESFEVAAAALRRECVSAKESLSVETSVDIPVMLPGGVMQPVTVTRTDLEHLIRPAVDESIGSFRRAVAGAGVTEADLSAVLLVGGSCRLPIVRDSLAAAVGDSVALLDADPKHAVARGAALLAGDGEPMANPQVSEAAVPLEPVVPTVAPEPTPPAAPTPQPEPAPAAASQYQPATAEVPLADEDRRGISPMLLVALAAGLVLLALPLAWFFTRDNGSTDLDNQASPAPNGSGSDQASQTGTSLAASTGGASGQDMVAIPAGDYTVGTDEPSSESVAAFTVTVDDFHLDAFEVTHEQYLAFVQQIGAPPPLSWDRGQPPVEQSDHPVTGVDFVWAEAYCLALGKRLPTDAQWEVGARGSTGALYPTGETDDGLDLDQGGSRPAGSTAANRSDFGVHDAVGGVWEWVREPYAPIDAGTQVRRGGQYGRVRDGAAMRQAVDPAGQATIIETGFRCAADVIDPSREPLLFGIDHDLPEQQASGGAGPADAGAGDGLLVDDSFDNTGSGFADIDEGDWRIGYHAPSWYHLEAAGPNTQVVSLGGYNLADGEVELTVYIDKTETSDGQYRYGLIFRSGGAIKPAPVGFVGPPRPEVYYAFVINPRAGVWELLHEDELPQRVQASGPLPPVAATDPDNPDVLKVSMQGAAVTFWVNGEELQTFDTQGFHVEAGNLGLYAETFDETFVHVHFDRLTINQ